jgi:hypothetical protein
VAVPAVTPAIAARDAGLPRGWLSWRVAGVLLLVAVLAAALILWRLVPTSLPDAGPVEGLVPQPSSPAAATPQELPAGSVLRVTTGERFPSLAAALAAAGAGDEIWMGPGRYAVPAAAIGIEVHLRGAGAAATTLDAEGRTGLVVAAGAGSLTDLEVCCARTGALLDLRDGFAGIVSRVRLRDGLQGGLRVRAPSAPTIDSLAIEGVTGDGVVVEPGARPVLHGVGGS